MVPNEPNLFPFSSKSCCAGVCYSPRFYFQLGQTCLSLPFFCLLIGVACFFLSCPCSPVFHSLRCILPICCFLVCTFPFCCQFARFLLAFFLLRLRERNSGEAMLSEESEVFCFRHFQCLLSNGPQLPVHRQVL